MRGDKRLANLLRAYRLLPHAGQRQRVDGEWLVIVSPVIHDDADKLAVVYERESTGDHYMCSPRAWRGMLATVRPTKVDNYHWDERPDIGSRWRHHDGTIYKVVTNAFDAVTGKHQVVYIDEKGGPRRACSFADWNAIVQPDKRKGPVRRLTRLTG